MSYSEEELSELAEATLHAYYNWHNIYHDKVLLGIAFMMKMFNMTELEVITKIKEIKGVV